MAQSDGGQGRVLIVDDSAANLDVATRMVETMDLSTTVASNGKDALLQVDQAPPDIILLDLVMPELDGFEVCRRLKANPATRNIPIIVLTALNDTDDYIQAIECGADDFMNKPFNLPVLQVRLKRLLKEKKLNDKVIEYQRKLEQRVVDQTVMIQEVQDVTVYSLAKLAECRDPETGDHLERIRHYCLIIAQNLAESKLYGTAVNEQYVNILFRSSILHDIGKVGIRDEILLKPGRLTPEEFDIMKMHSAIGGDALNAACQLLPNQQFLEMARAIAYHHHEKWDGSGYPYGLSGRSIPLSSRIVAIADVFDALLSKRPYKEPMPMAKALEILQEGREKHFDPVLLDCFFKDLGRVQRVGEEHTSLSATMTSILSSIGVGK